VTRAMAGVTALVLAGGKGTRIAGLYPDIPKPMIPVAGRPFLHWITAWLVDSGIRDIVYSIGHLAPVVEAWIKDEGSARGGARLRTMTEAVPLGTGGAMSACLDLCGPWVLVANGDSLVKADLSSTLAQVAAENLDGAIIGIPMADTSRYGSLEMDDGRRLRGFFEKRPGSGLINAGIYLLKRGQLARFPPGQVLSMETDIVPGLLAQGAHLGVVVSDQPFLDIGTPESIAAADGFIRSIFPGV